MQHLRVAVLQQDIIWENEYENLAKIEFLVEALGQDVDLVVLPEMFHCGFTMRPESVAQRLGGSVVKWMHKMANALGAHIMGSVVERFDSSYVNRLYVIGPGGVEFTYDKRHLFRMGGENKAYTAGCKRLVVTINGWRICPLICYDLRFPVWSRNQSDYDVLVYVANWPSTRRDVWCTLLKARAIENQSYVIGANRVGNDGANTYAGDSMVIDAKGNEIAGAREFEEKFIMSELNYEELFQFREKFPAWKDRDNFTIHL